MSRSPVVFGKYQLLERLAQGGMAEVYKAKAYGVEGFEKILVIKRILPKFNDNPRFVELFINEAKIAVTLSHANIVQVFDLGQVDGSYFIAMEYVSGPDLHTLLNRGIQPMPPMLAVYLVGEIAKALDYAHRRRDSNQQPLHIVHRDVSPQNIVISNEGEVKLADFGIARARTSLDHEDHSLYGKFAYMSPEQARGDPLDARSDLFALGSILYECVAGTHPFGAQDANEILRRVRSAQFEPLSEFLPASLEPLCSIVDKALAADPQDRYQNAGQLYEDLIQFLYAEGQHVGGKALSEYMARIMGLATRARGTTGIRRALLADSLVHTGTDATPIEIPKKRRSLSSSVRPKPDGARPQSELRDLTILAMGPHDAASLPDDLVQPMIRFGGRLLNSKPTAGWWYLVFGLDAPDGHDTDTAVRFFLLLRRIMLTGHTDVPSFQVGIHCGRAILDGKGELIRDKHCSALLSDATTTAELAQPGQVLLTPDAERAARRSFELRRVSGTERWAVVHERKSDETQGKFVGRQNELKRFGELLADATRGSARTIVLVGEAGAGKSRLLSECARRLRLGGHDIGVYVARLHRQTSQIPFGACLEMLRVILGIDALDPPVVVKHKAQRLRELGLPNQERLAIESLLGVDVEPVGFAHTQGLPITAAISRIAARLAEDRLTIFGFDGIESADPESLSVLRSVLEITRTSNVVVVLSHPPGELADWTVLPGYETIRIGNLNKQTTQSLAAHRLGVAEIPNKLLDDIVAKSAGNPLYVEEYVRALQDADAVEPGADGKLIFRPDVAAVDVPKTLRGMMAARLLRLAPRTRNLVQVAAVAGQRVILDLLAKTTGQPANVVKDTLAELQHHGLVIRQNNEEYRLANELIGEVIRDGLTIDARRQLHLAIAGAIESLYPNRLDEFAERLSHHYDEGGDRKRAIANLVRAAGRLEDDLAFSGALTHLEKALDTMALVPDLDRTERLELYLKFGELCLRSRQLQRGAARMIAGLDLADGLGRDDYAARFCMLRGQLLSISDRIEESRDWLQRARNIARRHSGQALIRDVMIASAEVETRNRNFMKAVEALQEAYVASVNSADKGAQLRCLIALGVAFAGSGNKDKALHSMAEARILAGPNADQITICDLFEAEARVHYYVGNREESIEAAENALEIAKEHGFMRSIVANANCAGECYLRLRKFKKAFARLRYSYDVSKEFGFQKMQHTNLRTLGFLDVMRSGSSEGRKQMVDACRYASKNSHVGDLIQGTFMLAYADQTLQRHGDALKGFREAMRLARSTGNTLYEDASRRALDAMAVGHPVELPV